MTEPVIDLLDAAWSSIAELCAELDPAHWDTDTELPGWTVRDVVSHMVGTERMLAGDPVPAAPSQLGAHVRNPIGELNEAWVDERRSTPGATLLAEFIAVTQRRLTELRTMPPSAWDEVGANPEGEGTYRRFMEIRVFDCWEHEQDIRRVTARPGHLDGPVAALSVGEVTSKLGYIVGKKVGAPDGSIVLFDITGTLPQQVAVQVDGRARIVDHLDDEPTTTIHLDTETFNALGCGRWPGDQALAAGRVRFTGDVELGRQVIDNMSFTI